MSKDCVTAVKRIHVVDNQNVLNYLIRSEPTVHRPALKLVNGFKLYVKLGFHYC